MLAFTRHSRRDTTPTTTTNPLSTHSIKAAARALRKFENVFFSYKRQMQVLPQRKFIELQKKYNNNKNNNDIEIFSTTNLSSLIADDPQR